MAIFGKKNDNDEANNELNEQDLDAMIMAAIEETDEEEAVRKEEARKAHEEMLEKNRILEEKKREAIERIKALPNQGRRYFLLVEEAVAADNKVKITGNIHGEIHVGDETYIYRPGGAILTTTVEEILMVESGEKVEATKTARIEITVPFDFEKIGYEQDGIVPKFSVVSDVQVQDKNAPGKPVDNPALLGATLEYKTFKDDHTYMGVLVGHLSKAKFVIPVNSTPEELQGKDGKRQIRFMMIKGTKEDAKPFLPVFTDWGALKQWKELTEGGKKPAVIVVSFMDLAKITAKDEPDLVINPFGPVAIHLPSKLIKDMATIREKVAKQAIIKQQTIKAAEAAKILVTEPLPSKETDEVKEALRNFAKSSPSVASFGLLTKVQNNKRGYLVIVDCPKTAIKDVYIGMHAAAKPYMKNIKTMDFSLYSETVFADDYFSNHTLDYVRIGI